MPYYIGGGGGVKWIFQNGVWKISVKSSIYFFTIILSFLGKKISSEIHVFLSDQFSFPSSATVKMDYEENMENARYATNDNTPL